MVLVVRATISIWKVTSSTPGKCTTNGAFKLSLHKCRTTIHELRFTTSNQSRPQTYPQRQTSSECYKNIHLTPAYLQHRTVYFWTDLVAIYLLPSYVPVHYVHAVLICSLYCFILMFLHVTSRSLQFSLIRTYILIYTYVNEVIIK